MATDPTRLTVDAIEGDVAVLVDSSHQWRVPVAWLPEGAKEGSVLHMTLSLAPEDQAELEERVRRLLGRAKKDDITL